MTPRNLGLYTQCLLLFLLVWELFVFALSVTKFTALFSIAFFDARTYFKNNVNVGCISY